MRAIPRKAIRRSAILSWGLLTFLTPYFLSLCVLNPQLHAELVHQAAQAYQTSARHCPLPASTPEHAGSFPSRQEGTSRQVCCSLVGTYKAIKVSALQPDLCPVLTVRLLLPETGSLLQEGHSQHLVSTVHSANPPPLYLLHAALLI